MKCKDALVLFSVVLLALAITACSPVSTPAPADVQQVEDDAEAVADAGEAADVAGETPILGTSWSVVTYGLEADTPPVENTTLTLNFLAERYTGYTGCNYVQGAFNADGDTLTVRWPAESASTCEDEVLARQESDFLTALTTADSYAITDGQLQLYYGDVSIMTLAPLEAVPFEGTTWNLQFIQQQPVGWVPPLEGATLTAVFDGETVSGNAGCNDYSGSYTIENRTIQFGDISATEMACENQDLMQQETDYLQALQNAAIIMQHARAFELRDGEGISMMIFGAQ